MTLLHPTSPEFKPRTQEDDFWFAALVTSVPIPNIVSTTRIKISRVATFDQSDVVWTSDVAFTGYQFRIVASAADPVTSGSQVEINQNPAAGGSAATEYTSFLTNEEIEAVSPAEGPKIVKLFLENANGWSA